MVVVVVMVVVMVLVIVLVIVLVMVVVGPMDDDSGVDDCPDITDGNSTIFQ